MFKKNKKFKVACVQMNSQDNLQDNILFAKKKIVFAAKKGAKLILLPENCFLMPKNDKQFFNSTSEEKNHLGINEDKVTENSKFIEDLGADSLDQVELVMAFEEEFKCEIPDEAAEKIVTVKDAIDLIKTKTS